MQMVAILVLGFGLLVGVGGVIGWRKAGSRASLISGLAFGFLLALCGYAIWEGRRFGLQAGAGISLALAVIMGRRFLASRKFMPAGLVALLGVVTAVVLFAAMWG